MERVVVTGIGLVSPCGSSTDTTWRALLESKSGVGSISLFEPGASSVRIAAECSDFAPREQLSKKQLKETGRFSQMALVASRACLLDAGIELSDEDRERCGTIIGVGLGGLEYITKYSHTLRDRGPRKVSPYFIPQVIANLAAGQVAMDLGLQGVSYCTTSACASSAHAIGSALDWIRAGRSELMLAGGAEATLTALGVAGFAAMHALSRRNDEPERASRPWDKDRDGFVMGEGAATLLLESLPHARARGARIYAEVSGFGASCDAHHITQPAPNGRGAIAAMRMAVEAAKLRPAQIDYINAHGTSTPQGDLQESCAIATLFGSHALDKQLWISSTKSAMGHLLGAAGAMEAAICALALKHGQVPPTLNLDEQDPECPLEFVANQARSRTIQHALSNSFGFGGTNAALVLSRVDD